MTGTASTRVSTGTLLVLAAVILPRPAIGQQNVTLTFDWPADMHAQVEYTATRSRTVRGQSQQMEMQGTYDIDTEAVEDGLRVSFSNLEVDIKDVPGADTPQGRLQEFMAKAGARIPDYVVDESGNILRVEGLDELRANLEAALAEISAPLPEQTRRSLQAMIRQTLTRERLEAGVRQNWNRDVGNWNGTTLEVGQSYEKVLTSKSPMLGNLDVPMKLVFELRDRRRCHEAAADDSCVELEMRSSVDSQAVSKAFERHLRSLGGQATTPTLGDMSIDQRVVLLTEPDTLVPHSMQTRRTTSMTFSVNGVGQTTEQREEMTVFYRYRR